MFIEVRNLSKQFRIERGIAKRTAGYVRALDGVSFGVEEFQTLGVVGESGSGKTTLAKVLLKLIPPTSGEVVFDGGRITNLRKDAQIIFQNPYNSLDTKMRVVDIIAEPLLVHRMLPPRQARGRAAQLLEQVGLDRGALLRFPGQFSGGQRQRICIARALASEPKFLVLDEPISSLDLTVQADMLELFIRLKEKLRLTYLFISHNLAVIKHIADRVIVMQGGKIVEEGPSAAVLAAPRHPYTQLLLEAAR